MICSIQKWQEAGGKKLSGTRPESAGPGSLRKVLRPESRGGQKMRSDGRWTGNEWMCLSGGNGKLMM